MPEHTRRGCWLAAAYGLGMGRVNARVSVLAAALLIMCTGCSDDGNDGARNEAGEVADPVAVRELLGRYVEALNAGDVDAAMAVRCPEQRVSADQRELFATQLGQLRDQVGSFEVRSVARSGLLPGDAGFTYRINDDPGDLVTELTPGRDGFELCFSRPAASFDIEAGLQVPVPDAGPAPTAVGDALPTVAPGLVLAEDGPVSGERTGAQEVVTRAWRSEDFGGARVTAGRYASDTEAAEAAGTIVDDSVPDSVARMPTPALPTAVGLRLLADAWLWVQPPSTGPYIDRVVTRFDDTVITIEVSGLPPDQQETVLQALANQVAALVAQTT